MPDDLATRLVHDAAEAIATVPTVGRLPNEAWHREARAAVVAVLEGLAHAYETDTPLMGAGTLRALAERVKETQHGR